MHVRYLGETCPLHEDGSVSHSVIRIGDDGIGCSSTWSGEGLNAVLYYYVDDEGQRVRRLESTGWGEGGEIWGGSGFLDRNIASFFVGSEEVFQDANIGSLKHLRETRPDWLRPQFWRIRRDVQRGSSDLVGFLVPKSQYLPPGRFSSSK